MMKMSIQPEWINTPGISDLDTGIDLSGISFIQSEINKTYGLKYAPVDGDGYCLLRAILVLKNMSIHGRWAAIRRKSKYTKSLLKLLINKRSRLLLIRHSMISGKM